LLGSAALHILTNDNQALNVGADFHNIHNKKGVVMNYKIVTMALVLSSILFACGNGSDDNSSNENTAVNSKVNREFSSSFESVDDFSNFYITPQAHLNTSFHEQSDAVVYSGNYSHKAWIQGANSPSSLLVNNNHRGYPTVQLYKTEKGSFESPLTISLWVWLDINLQANASDEESDWFSFATFTDDESDSWNRTILVNLSHDGFVHLQHTSGQGENDIIFQTTTLLFPQQEWVELTIYLDLNTDGYAKVWQNGLLVSHANIDNFKNKLAQAHFGMYSPPQLTSGVVYNDDLHIEMVNGE